MPKYIMNYYGYDIYFYCESLNNMYYYLQTPEDFTKTFYSLDSICDFIRQKPEVNLKINKQKKQYYSTKIYYKIPVGWSEIKGAATNPIGTMWISNKISHFAVDERGNKLRKTALLVTDIEIFKQSKFMKIRSEIFK